MPSGALFLAGRERAHEKPEPGESTQSGSPQPCVALECLKGHGALSAKYTLDFEDSKKKKKKEYGISQYYFKNNNNMFT